jgi:GTP-binding protein
MQHHNSSNYNPLLSWRFEQTTFLKSAPNLDQAPVDLGHEVAFVGRSNAGKSSALNAIVGQNRLARTSKTPGRTQLMNFFSITENKRLVDLPGYGYAKVSHRSKASIEALLQEYLQDRMSIQGLVLLMDIRHPLQSIDRQLIDLAKARELAVHILLTKCDKLNRGPANNIGQQVAKQLSGYGSGITVQTFSTLKGIGIDLARDKIAAWLETEF